MAKVLLAFFFLLSPLGGQEKPPNVKADSPASTSAKIGDSLLTLPPEVKGPASSFIVVKATTNCANVRWFVIDVGLSLLPPDLTRDSKTAIVMSGTPGRYKLLAYTAVGDMPSEPSVVVVIVGNAPPIPPGPIPPGPEPVPVPTKGFRVIFVYETADAITQAQANVIYSTAITDYLNSHTEKTEDRPGWKRWDRNVDTSTASDTWKKIWDVTKGSVLKVPALVIINESKGEVFELPATEADALELLKKYGGP